MKFEIKTTKDVSVSVRQNSGNLGFEWDAMYKAHQKITAVNRKVGERATFDVPVAFWTGERHMDPAEINTKKGPAILRDRIRQHFYDWRSKTEEAMGPGKFTGVMLAFGDNYEGEGTERKLASTSVVMVPQDEDDRKAGIERAKAASTARKANVAAAKKAETAAKGTAQSAAA